MNKQEIVFVIIVNDREVVKVGCSCVEHLAIQHDGRKTKWFDDSALRKEVLRSE